MSNQGSVQSSQAQQFTSPLPSPSSATANRLTTSSSHQSTPSPFANGSGSGSQSNSSNCSAREALVISNQHEHGIVGDQSPSRPSSPSSVGFGFPQHPIPLHAGQLTTTATSHPYSHLFIKPDADMVSADFNDE